jgi:hypothetical protein
MIDVRNKLTRVGALTAHQKSIAEHAKRAAANKAKFRPGGGMGKRQPPKRPAR